jgi:hypothetical protein
MARSQSVAGTPGPARSPTPSGRPSLIPENPLPGWKAFLQAVVLLGLPLFLLWLTRALLAAFFPDLGY